MLLPLNVSSSGCINGVSFPLAIKVKMSDLYMFCFDMEQFTNTRTGSRHKPYDKIPLIITVRFQARFEKLVVGIADYILQKVFLLYLDEFYLKFLLFCKFKVLVDTLQSKIYCLWLKVLHQVPLVCQEILFIHFPIMTEEILHRPHIRGDGVLGKRLVFTK